MPEPHYLREYRESFDMTLEAVGARLGITKSALSRIERGKYPWDQFILQGLSRVYGVSIPDLLYRHPVVAGRFTFRRAS
jgi:transcriptional regulator with XRE-family HTH domain